MQGKGQLPYQFADWLTPFHRAGLNVHMHCNRNLTQDLAIETVEKVLRQDPWPDHRHTITHTQLTTQAQLRKMAKLGLRANFFTNHIWYGAISTTTSPWVWKVSTPWSPALPRSAKACRSPFTATLASLPSVRRTPCGAP